MPRWSWEINRAVRREILTEAYALVGALRATMAEDALVYAAMLLSVRRVVTIQAGLYIYTPAPASATRDKSRARQLEHIQSFKNVIKGIRRVERLVQRPLHGFYCRCLILIFRTQRLKRKSELARLPGLGPIFYWLYELYFKKLKKLIGSTRHAHGIEWEDAWFKSVG